MKCVFFEVETVNSYHYSRTNQQKDNIKFFSGVQYDLCVNGCDWCNLAGNEKIIVEDCLNWTNSTIIFLEFTSLKNGGKHFMVVVTIKES